MADEGDMGEAEDDSFFCNYYGGEEDNDNDNDEDDDDDDDSSRQRGNGEPKKGEKQITVLLIGQSGSGKSTISKEIIASVAPSKRKVYVLLKNGKKEEENQPDGWKRIGFENLGEISNCALVVEDVLSSTKQDFADLKEVLHYSNHHR